ncbi:hypothetical protein Halha_1089 [Halobacteroides halobius DSM 5150]|uniref:PD-(D/E)XK endonuclease-like domain-containing protein n=1 Tax=Halobacteroides halobius (strain ATCC 35273 / DSM 5150 / MD-1) TaxID=748449 RepID=L0KAB0_HALHC|nr:PD-(D/E)XK nuclease family protein [Halobacteroides halobius]AGB41043.1 hypothetical protein Halha_1089 [Halobacteroides halobius DSM 5150]
MEMNYIDYSDNLFETVVDSSKSRVYVFNNYDSKLEAENYYTRPFLAEESSFLLMSEFKERLFPSDKLLLKEEKLVIIFYELLTEEDKKQLKISGYNDVINLAHDFFNFYRELAEYKVDEIKGLKGWQQEKYQIFERLRQRYIAKMEQLDYTDKILTYNEANFNLKFLQKFTEVVFVSILSFTPLEKEIIAKLQTAGHRVQLYNQIKPEDYDEETLQLKSVTLPDKLEQEIEIYQTNEDLLQLVTALTKVDRAEDGYTILDADLQNSNYHNLLSSAKVNIDQDISFTKTRLYRFLETLYNLLQNASLSNGEVRLKLEDLVEASYLNSFRDYYNLGWSELDGLQQLAQDDYVYFCEELITDQLTSFRAILKEIEELSQLRTLNQFCSYLEDIEIEKLNDSQYRDDLSTFFSSLAELQSIEELEVVSSWDQYFTNSPQGLFLLILNYLKFKQVKKVGTGNEADIEVRDLLTSSFAQRDQIMLLNLAEGRVPLAQEANFLLTDSQRTQLGLKSYQQQRLEMKYKFFRHLLSSKQVVIFAIKDQANNIATSSFVEELKLKYNLTSKELEVTSQDYPEIMKNIFNSNSDLLASNFNLTTEDGDKLKIIADDFSNQELSMTYYKYSTLKRYCSYRFYLDHIVGLEEQVEFSKQMSPKIIGILVHQTFAELIDKLEGKIKANDLRFDRAVVKEILTNKIELFDLKIPDYYEQYYLEVMFKSIEESIEYFFKMLSNRVEGTITDITTEWQPSQNDKRSFIENEAFDICLNGRVDLIIETDKSKQIIDYKTGSGNTDQLDFYHLLYESDFEVGEIINKSMYNVMERKFERTYPGSEEKFAETLKEVLEEQIVNSLEYQTDFKSRCKRCNYLDVCQEGLK